MLINHLAGTTGKAVLCTLILAVLPPAMAQGGGPGAPETRACTTVQANLEWQRSGVMVQPGQFVCVAAEGLWSHGGQGIQAIVPFYGPAGFAKDDPVNIPEVVARVGALVGRLGANAPFVIERQLCFIASGQGELSLAMNDDPGTFENNAGALHVEIATWPEGPVPERIHMRPQQCARPWPAPPAAR